MRPHIAQANHTLVLEWAWKGSHELKNMKSHLLIYLVWGPCAEVKNTRSRWRSHFRLKARKFTY